MDASLYPLSANMVLQSICLSGWQHGLSCFFISITYQTMVEAVDSARLRTFAIKLVTFLLTLLHNVKLCFQIKAFPFPLQAQPQIQQYLKDVQKFILITHMVHTGKSAKFNKYRDWCGTSERSDCNGVSSVVICVEGTKYLEACAVLSCKDEQSYT